MKDRSGKAGREDLYWTSLFYFEAHHESDHFVEEKNMEYVSKFPMWVWI